MPTLTLNLTPVETDDLRRLADRLADRQKKLDPIRTRVLEKLRKACHKAVAVKEMN